MINLWQWPKVNDQSGGCMVYLANGLGTKKERVVVRCDVAQSGWMRAHWVWCCLHRGAYLIVKDRQINLTAEQINMHTHRHWQIFIPTHTHIVSFSSNLNAWSKGTWVAVGWQSEVAFRILLALRWNWEGLAGPCVYKLHQPPLLNVKQLIPIRSQTPHRSASPSIHWLGALQVCLTNGTDLEQGVKGEQRQRFHALNAASDKNLRLTT